MRRVLKWAVGLYAVGALLPDVRPAPPLPPPAPPVAAPEPAGDAEGRAALQGDGGVPASAVVRRWFRLVVAAVRHGLKENITDTAAALAYYAFLAIPATLLVAVGLFGVFAGPDTIAALINRLEGPLPGEALTLVRDTLTRVTQNQGVGGLAILGLLLALWTASGAMNALMRGLNRVYEREETRSFVRQRLTALALLGWTLVAVALSFGLLVLGPPLSAAVGRAVDLETVARWIWWTAQWPILIAALLLSVAAILRLGPAAGPDLGEREPPPGWRLMTPGTMLAVIVWLLASGGFAVYVANFGNYGAAWGSLSAVIVMLTWLWLTSLAILLGGQVDAQALAEERDGARG